MRSDPFLPGKVEVFLVLFNDENVHLVLSLSRCGFCRRLRHHPIWKLIKSSVGIKTVDFLIKKSFVSTISFFKQGTVLPKKKRAWLNRDCKIIMIILIEMIFLCLELCIFNTFTLLLSNLPTLLTPSLGCYILPVLGTSVCFLASFGLVHAERAALNVTKGQRGLTLKNHFYRFKIWIQYSYIHENLDGGYPKTQMMLG